MLLKISTQLKVEIKYNILPLLFINLIIIGIAYFIFGLHNLNQKTQGIIIERFLPWIGIFTLVPFFYSEEKKPIKDVLMMRNTKIEFIYFIRFFIRILLYFTMTIMYISLLKGETFVGSLYKMTFHSISIGVFMGGLGLLIYALTTNINLAFLTSIGFMVIQWSASKDKAVLLLFTMPRISMSRIIIILSTFLLFFVWGLKIWKNKFIS